MGHLSPPTGAKANLLQKNPDDIVSIDHHCTSSSYIFAHPLQVITVALRTPITKARKGLLNDTPIEDLLIALLTQVREKSNTNPSLVEDVCVGNVPANGPVYVARSAVLAAGFPVTTATSVANRFCSSGLLAIRSIANQISAVQ